MQIEIDDPHRTVQNHPATTPRRRLLTITRRGHRDSPATAAALTELHDIAAAYDDPAPA